MKHMLGKLVRDRKAATAVEYGLIMALVVLGMMVGLINLASTTTGVWTNVAAKVTNAS